MQEDLHKYQDITEATKCKVQDIHCTFIARITKVNEYWHYVIHFSYWV